jgi:hypothetical protein
MIVSQTVYIGFVTLMVIGLVIGWIIHDGKNLVRTLRRQVDDPDLLFGSVIGLLLAAIGLAGVIMYHLDL